jgi:CDP-alcohol phosphatidyltransferase
MTIREKYRKGLKPLVVEEWVDLAIFRPLGFVVAYPLSFTPVTPNQVTFLSAIVGIVGGWAMWQGSNYWMAIGAWLYLLSNVLDCTDGQLARMTKRFSRYGRILDGAADYVVGIATFAGIGFGCQPENYNVWFWWALLLVGGGWSTMSQSMHLNHVRQAYLKMLDNVHKGESHAHKGEKSKKRNSSGIFNKIFLGLYISYLKGERFVRRRVKVPLSMSEEMRESPPFKTMLILWTFNGKGTHVALLAIALFLGRPEYYFWFCLVPMNIFVFILRITHRKVISNLLANEVTA